MSAKQAINDKLQGNAATYEESARDITLTTPFLLLKNFS